MTADLRDPVARAGILRSRFQLIGSGLLSAMDDPDARYEAMQAAVGLIFRTEQQLQEADAEIAEGKVLPFRPREQTTWSA